MLKTTVSGSSTSELWPTGERNIIDVGVGDGGDNKVDITNWTKTIKSKNVY